MRARTHVGSSTKLSIAFCTLLLLYGRAGATDVSGNCPVGGLTLAGSPWRLTGTVNVPAATTCTIEPGVVITGQGNTLAVNGTLPAQGTMALPISFNNVWVSLGAGS